MAACVGDVAVFEVQLSKGDALAKWSKDGQDLVQSDRVKVVIDGKHQRLIISDCILSDEGSYSCAVGNKKCSAKLAIHGKVSRHQEAFV